MQITDIDSNKDKEENRLTNFVYSIKSEASRQVLLKCVKYHMNFLCINTLGEVVEKPQKLLNQISKHI